MHWLQRLFGKAEAAPIDGGTWETVCRGLPFLAQLDDLERQALHAMAGKFIARKSFSGAAGFELTDHIVVAIAAQACLPVLHLDLGMFDDFSEIIVYPGEFHVEREFVDDAGVVHDVSGALSGEAMPGGPVVVSWEDIAIGAAQTNGRPAYNVVIHEFVHKLDLATGAADGLPIMHPRLHAAIDTEQWCEVLDEAHAQFCDMVDALEAGFPSDLDPESDAGLRWYDTLPLDAYGADDPAEFFAVASETYFVAPERLRTAFAALYGQLDRYYRPDLTDALPSPPPRSGNSD